MVQTIQFNASALCYCIQFNALAAVHILYKLLIILYIKKIVISIFRRISQFTHMDGCVWSIWDADCYRVGGY